MADKLLTVAVIKANKSYRNQVEISITRIHRDKKISLEKAAEPGGNQAVTETGTAAKQCR